MNSKGTHHPEPSRSLLRACALRPMLASIKEKSNQTHYSTLNGVGHRRNNKPIACILCHQHRMRKQQFAIYHVPNDHTHPIHTCPMTACPSRMLPYRKNTKIGPTEPENLNFHNPALEGGGAKAAAGNTDLYHTTGRSHGRISRWQHRSMVASTGSNL